MNTWYLVAIGVCFCASCGTTSDVPHGSMPDASAGSDAEVCGSAMPIPQAHRAVSENCPAERGSIGPVDTTSCTDTSRITCTSDADCASGSNGRCLQSGVDLCQTYCSSDDCLTDTDCPEGPCFVEVPARIRPQTIVSKAATAERMPIVGNVGSVRPAWCPIRRPVCIILMAEL